VKHRAHIAAREFLLVVGVAEEGECHAVCAERGLDDIGDVLLLALNE